MRTSFHDPRGLGLVALLVSALFVGCSARPSGYELVTPEPIEVAEVELPENQLLDVGVAITEARELDEKEMEKLGTNEDIRDSECHYLPVHLKNTMQSSAQWGAVQVVPNGDAAVDLTINTELVRSNGEMMQVEVQAVDASGRVWLKRKYHADADEYQYGQTEPEHRDAFQAMYNTIANDMAEFKRSLSPEQIQEIRTVAKLRFAREFAPEAYEDYLVENGSGELIVQRLPSDDDPFMARIDKIRDREDMFVDTLNAYYEGLYVNMWDAYENWRRYNYVELEAMRQLKHEAFMKTLSGVLMIAAAIALQTTADFSGADTASGMLILAGGQVAIGGINISEQAKIHGDAVQELGDSFGAEMRPTIVELEGKQYELTGTADEQFAEWKDLLREIYYEETGFGPAPDPADDA